MSCTLFVPNGSLGAYRNADQWKDFLFVVEFNGIEDVVCDEPSATPYINLQGQKVQSPCKGEIVVSKGKRALVK